MSNNETWRDLGIAYSLATIWFIVPLKELLYPGSDYYFLAEPHSVFEYLAIFADVLLLSLVFFLLLSWIRRSDGTRLGTTAKLAFVFIVVIAFGSLSYELMKWITPNIRSGVVSLVLPALVLLVILITGYRAEFRIERFAKSAKFIVLLLLPFALLTLFQGFRNVFAFDDHALSPSFVESPPTASSPSTRRVVWVIFDELDYAALSTASKNSTNVDAIDRLMSESFVAHGASSPNINTMESLPALLTGHHIERAEASSSRDLLLYPGNGEKPINLRKTDSVFTDVQSLGGTNAIVGWYHPYSRLFEDEVSYCYWSPQATPRCAGRVQFAECSSMFFIRSLERLPLGQRLLPSSLWTAEDLLKDEDSETQYKRHDFLLNKAENLLERADVSLMFIHFSVPHYPTIALQPHDGKESYFTSLEVVNETVRRLRDVLEKSGKWEDTVLIVSSDHRWRVKSEDDFRYLPGPQGEAALDDTRIPFIVRFPGQSARVDFDVRFNTIVSRHVVADIVAGKINSSLSLRDWLLDSLNTTTGTSLTALNQGTDEH